MEATVRGPPPSKVEGFDHTHKAARHAGRPAANPTGAYVCANSSRISPAGLIAVSSCPSDDPALDEADMGVSRGGIDKVVLRLPASASLPALPTSLHPRASDYYLSSYDLRPLGIDAILHRTSRFGRDRHHKLELLGVGTKSAPEIEALVQAVTDAPPARLQIMRLDLFADIEGVDVPWFFRHAHVRHKQASGIVGRWSEQKRIQTLHFGRAGGGYRIYDKVAERLYRYEKLRRTASGLPPFMEVFGHSPNLTLTRVERQFSARIPEALQTVGSLFANCAALSPFDTLVLTPGRIFPSPSTHGGSLSSWLQARGLWHLIEDVGQHAAHRFINRHSQGNAHRFFKRLLPQSTDSPVTIERLQAIYRNGVRHQLFGSEVAEPPQGRFPPS